jgi:C-terminal processing protease CtpA/Prc
MTRRSDSLSRMARFTSFAALAGAITVLAAASASAQQDRPNRSDRASNRDDSAQNGDPSTQYDQRRRSAYQDSSGQNSNEQNSNAQATDRNNQDRTSRTRGDQDPSSRSAGQASDRNQDNSQRDRQPSSGVAWLGVFLQDSEGSQEGAQVRQIYPAGPAARAGLRPGDVIIAVGDEDVSDSDDLISAIEDELPGSRAELTILRNNQRLNLPVTLGNRDHFAFRDQDNDQSSGQGGGQYRNQGGGQPGGQYGQPSGQGNNRYGQGGGGQFDHFSNLPPFAMQLEHERRLYEQNQRIETQIARLQDEVRQLREAVQQQQRR